MTSVKLSKLWGAVRRELIAHPKKAAVLAILLAAAAWFWGPIAWRNFGGKPAAVPAITVAPAAAVAATSQANPHRGGQQNSPVASWNRLLAARQQNPLTQPAEYDPNWPQPFKVTPKTDAALAGGGTDATGHSSALLTPAEVGIVLESIVYGKSKRAAVINGEIYREGSEVAVATATGGPVSFQVVAIDRARVALERYGRTYWLEFPRPMRGSSGRNERIPQPSPPSRPDQP